MNTVLIPSLSDSNIHTSEPSSFTSFHHLKPTKSLSLYTIILSFNYRPATFFTNQKSKAEKITTIMKTKASLFTNMFRNKKATIETALKRRVKKTTNGWFACWRKFVMSMFWFVGGALTSLIGVPPCVFNSLAPIGLYEFFVLFSLFPAIGMEKSKF